MEKNFEDRPIPGVTVKGLVWFFGGVIAVIISVMTAMFVIKSDIKDANTESRAQAVQQKILIDNLTQSAIARDTEIKTLQLQMQTLELQNARIEEQLKQRNNGSKN